MKHLFLSLLLFIGTNTVAQEVLYEDLGLENGLPSEHVYDIFKDSKSFIWFTCDEGLVRFNGSTFKVFHLSNSVSSIGSMIKEDTFGRIWYQSFDGYLLYVEDEELHLLKHHDISGYTTYDIEKEFLYLPTLKGVLRIDLKTLKSEALVYAENVLYCHVFNDHLFYGNKEVFTYNLHDETSEKVAEVQAEILSLVSVSNDQYMAIADRSKPNSPFVLLNENGIKNAGELTLPETLQNLYLLEDEIWCFTRAGIIPFDFSLHQLPEKKLLQSENVSSFTRDNNNSLWVGSPGSGIFMIDDVNTRAYSIVTDEFSAITQRNGKIFTGTVSGKIHQHRTNLEPELYYNTGQKNHILFMDFQTFPNWNFFTGNGFYAAPVESNNFVRSVTSVKDIAYVDERHFAIAATGYALITETGPLSIEEISKHPILKTNRAKSCAYDQKDRSLWVASNNGLFCTKENSKKEILYKNEPIYAKEIRILDNTLWGLTNDGRLFHVEDEHVKFVAHEERFHSIKISNGKVYLSSRYSIWSLDENGFKKQTGLGGYDRIIDFEIVGSNVYVITSKKLIQLTLNAGQKNRGEVPKIYLQSIHFGDRRGSINGTNSLESFENTIQIEYSVVNFDKLHKYAYHYVINGQSFPINQDEPLLIIPELQPDSYQIHFEVVDVDSKHTIFKSPNLLFSIAPPIWQRSWFIGLIVFTMLLIMILIYRRQMEKARKKHREMVRKLVLERDLKESRLQLIKSQMNPHFFFNAINNIQSYIFTNETKEASNYLSKFSKLTRKILEFSDRNRITLMEEVEALQLYLELQQMRFEDFNFSIDLKGIKDAQSINIPTMLFQPYVENALLHGLSHSTGDKKLTITFENKDGYLVGEISDNGIGRIKSAEINSKIQGKPTSFATKANQERIMLLNRDQFDIQIEFVDLYTATEESAGTRVIIKLKMDHEAESDNH